MYNYDASDGYGVWDVYVEIYDISSKKLMLGIF